tara:strand:+ start:7144 stop:9150 length:2007 start_codon:yes stop_codon:yes gene_type:complete
MAEFKKHMMYGDGKSKMANTKKEHLNLKAKGWGNTKPKTSSPLEINQALVSGAGKSNYQFGGETSLSAGEWKGELMTKPIMDAILGKQLTEEEKKKNDDDNNNGDKKDDNNNGDTGGDELNSDSDDDSGGGDELGDNDNVIGDDEFDDFEMNEGVDSEGEESESTDNTEVEAKVDALEVEKEKAVESGDKNKIEEYEVQIAKEKRKLANAFGLFGRKDKQQYSEEEQASMRADYYKAKRAMRTASTPEEKASLQAVMDASGAERVQTMVMVTMPDGSKEKMTNDEAQALMAEKEATHYTGNTNTRNNGVKTRTGKYYTKSPATARQTILGSRFKRKNSKGDSPYAYKERRDSNAPFYQVEDYDTSMEEQEAPVQKEELEEIVIEGNVFDLMNRVGPIDSKEWVGEAALIGDEKSPQLLGSSAILGITNFMKTQRDALDEIKKAKGTDSDGLAIINNVRALSTNMNKVGTFFSENIDAIDQENESKGSSVANSYLRDIVLTQKTDEEGKPLTTMMVDNNNELAIKFMGTKGVHSLKTIKKDIFPKAYDSFEIIAKGMSTVKSEATSGAPFNENAAMALINNAIKTEQHVLSTIHDDESPLSNFMNDFAEQFPDANGDFAIIDSPNYSLEDLEPLVKDYALMKLKAQHALYSKQDNQPSQVAQDLIAKYS